MCEAIYVLISLEFSMYTFADIYFKLVCKQLICIHTALCVLSLMIVFCLCIYTWGVYVFYVWCVCVRLSLCACVCVYINAYMCVYISVYVFVCVHKCLHVCVH